MAYSVSNPPSLVYRATERGAVWIYASADAEAAFDDTDYITNADELGMKSGDMVWVIDTTNGLGTIAQVTVDVDGNGTLGAPTAFA